MTNYNEAYVIIASVNKHFIHLCKIWLITFRKFNLRDKLVLVVFDDESECFAQQQEISYKRLQGENARDIFVNRMYAIRDYLDKGYNVIHTDIDAYWLKSNIFDLFQKEDDLSFSIEYGSPIDVVGIWGFALCCGFFHFRSSLKAIEFMDLWIIEAEKEKHDQNALNRLLLSRGLIWEENSKNSNVAHFLDLTIRAIEIHKVSRNAKFLTDETIVFHPWLEAGKEMGKTTYAVELLKKNGLLTPTEQQELETFLHSIKR